MGESIELILVGGEIFLFNFDMKLVFGMIIKCGNFK